MKISTAIFHGLYCYRPCIANDDKMIKQQLSTWNQGSKASSVTTKFWRHFYWKIVDNLFFTITLTILTSVSVQVCVIRDVISMVCTLIEHSPRPIIAREIISYCKNMNVWLRRRVKDPCQLVRICTLKGLADLVDEPLIPFRPYK